MKPLSCRSTEISERIFNYRLSWARRVVENAFGILSAKFMVFRAPIALKLSTTRSIVLACTTTTKYIQCMSKTVANKAKVLHKAEYFEMASTVEDQS